MRCATIRRSSAQKPRRLAPSRGLCASVRKIRLGQSEPTTNKNRTATRRALASSGLVGVAPPLPWRTYCGETTARAPHGERRPAHTSEWRCLILHPELHDLTQMPPRNEAAARACRVRLGDTVSPTGGSGCSCRSPRVLFLAACQKIKAGTPPAYGSREDRWTPATSITPTRTPASAHIREVAVDGTW